MNPANQIEEPTSESAGSRMIEPQRRVSTLTSLCTKLIACSKTLSNLMDDILKLGIPTTICDDFIKAKHDLSYLIAKPLNNDDFAMFADENCAAISRLDLRNCEIDDSMLNKLLSVHGKTLKYLDLRQREKFSCAAIPESIDLRNLHTLVLGDQLDLFSSWRPRGNKVQGPTRLLTWTSPKLRILSVDVDLNRWEDVFWNNKETLGAWSNFLKELLEPVRPNQVEVVTWNHVDGEQVWNADHFACLQSLSLPSSYGSALQSALSTAEKFRNLRSLNISSFRFHVKRDWELLDYENSPDWSVPDVETVLCRFDNPAITLFNLVKSLPHLESLEISGTNLTSPATNIDPLPLGPYRVDSTIPGLLGLHKPLKFLAVCWCPHINDQSQIPATVVASFRDVADRLNALRHYHTKPRIFVRLLSSCIGKIALMKSREFLDVICSKEFFESLVNLIDSYVWGDTCETEEYFCIGNVLRCWAFMYEGLSEAEKRDARYVGLLERIQQAALQFTEVLLTIRTDDTNYRVIFNLVDTNYRAIFHLLRVSNDITPIFPDAADNEVYISQLLCTVEHILARGIPALLQLESLSEVGRIFGLLGDRVACGNDLVRRHLAERSIHGSIWPFALSSDSKELELGANHLLTAIKESKFDSWQGIIQGIRVDESAWIDRLLMFDSVTGPVIETVDDLRGILMILNDDKQTPRTRYNASVLLAHTLLAEQVSSAWLLDQECRNRIRNDVWQTIVEFWSKGYSEVALLSFQQLVRFACAEDQTVQLWAFWSIGQVRLPEILANNDEIPRLREAIDDLKKFNDAGFAVPGELLEMANNAREHVEKVYEK